MPTDADKANLTLLGHTESLPQTPDQAILETFSNQNRHRNYWIKLECLEFSSLCPVTGQPDYARIKIEYVPDDLCVETKSLKFYLASYRNTKGFNEEIVNQIADDLTAVCSPKKLFIRGEFAARGGISLTIEAQHPQEEF